MRKQKIRMSNGPAPTPTANTPKFWNVVSEAGSDSATITLYGDVCDREPTDWWSGEAEKGLFITPEGFLEDLALVRDKAEITIKINSGGGDLYTGIAIHNELKGLKGHKTVIVEGIAASAASVIACAGDDVQVHPGSMIMIHEAATVIVDFVNAEDLKKYAKSLEAANAAIAQIYHEKTGLEVDKLRSMMKSETWMIGQDAVSKGFANTLLTSDGPDMSVSADSRMLIVAGIRHDIRAFRNVPTSIPVKQDAPAPAVANKNQPEDPGKKGGSSMTEQELREQHPEAVAAIESKAAAAARTEAVTAERARLQAIESIEAQIGDKQLIADAKYGEGACSAEQLALKAMQAQAKQGESFLAGLKKDGEDSGVKGVTGAPNSGNGDQGGDDAAEFAGLINAYKKQTGGVRK